MPDSSKLEKLNRELEKSEKKLRKAINDEKALQHQLKQLMAIIVSDMARQEDVTEALKAADQMEWARRMNNIHSRAEEIVLTELVYE